MPCPRSSKVCWFIHPNEPEWTERGGGLKVPSSPRRSGGGQRRDLSSGRGRGRSRSRSRSRSRGRGRGRSRNRSRSRSSGRFASPNRRRAILSSPPRRPRNQRPYSPRSRSNSRRRSRSPARRRPYNRRPRTRTPISSSRGPSPPKCPKSDRPPPKVKLEPSTDILPSASPKSVNPVLEDTNPGAMGDQPPASPRGVVDRQHHHQPLSLDLSFDKRATATPTFTQPPSPQTAPLSPVFVPKTPVIPGFPSSVPLTQPQVAAISALQKSLELVIKDQGTDLVMKPLSTPPIGSSSASQPATVLDGEKTEVWTTRVKCVEFASSVKQSHVC